MKKPILPPNESERLKVLDGYSIMDSLPEKEYDAITQLASYICETPIALVSLLDEDRQWFKSRIGLDADETPRDISFCQYTIMGDELFEVNNALENETFANNPLVTGYPNIQFYAGVPLRDTTGYNLGSLCVIDTKPRILTNEQKRALKLLADQVVSLINLRKNNLELIKSRKEFQNFMDISIDLVMIANVNGLFHKINPALTNLLGYSKEEIEGTPFADYIHPDDLDKTAKEVEKLSRGEMTISFENRYRTKKGEYVLLSWKASPDIETGNLYCIARDITLAKKQEEDQINITNELTAILNSSEFSIIATELDGTIKQFNKGAEILLGYKAEEVVGKTSPAIMHLGEEIVKRSEELSIELGEQVSPGFDTFVIKTRKSGMAHSSEWTYVRKDGSTFPIILSLTSIKNNLGEITGYLGIAKDITKEKVAELNLINSNKFLDDSQRIAKTGSWRYDLSTNDVIWSKGHYRIFEMDEFPADELFDEYRSKLLPEDVKELDDLFENTIKTGEGFQYNLSIIFSEERIKYIYIIGKAIKNVKGRIIGMQGTIQDITDQKRIEEELINARNLAEQSVKVKEQFLTNMSHEIRTPMNGIIGFARILEDTKLDKDQKQSVEAIKRASENLMVIINDILDFSKIEADKMTFEGVNFSLSKTVNSVIELFGPKAKEQKIKLLCEIDSDINDILIGDPTRLSQILINLVGNALKFTQKGYVELIISQVDETEFETTVQFSVIDTGIGIPKNKIDSIFESFNQASNETTRKYGGTGLGLTITRKFIELQGGIISVKSEESKGSEFSFFIRYEKAKKGDVIIEREPLKQLTPEFLKNIKILLVEDNDLNQLLAIKIFEKWEKDIDIADNGKIAIEKIEKNHYDIILMDIQMPEMDGYDLTRYIRLNMGTKSNIPIIALTAHATLGEEQKCLDLGMNDYLTKPFDSYKLLEKLYQNIYEIHVDSSSVPSKKESVSENLIDLKYLKDFAEGDSDFINEMIALFLKNTPIALVSILESNQNNDIKKLKAEIHKLKSSLGLLGIIKGSESVENIESKIESNPSGFGWQREVENLNAICEQAIIELKSIVKHS